MIDQNLDRCLFEAGSIYYLYLHWHNLNIADTRELVEYPTYCKDHHRCHGSYPHTETPEVHHASGFHLKKKDPAVVHPQKHKDSVDGRLISTLPARRRNLSLAEW